VNRPFRRTVPLAALAALIALTAPSLAQGSASGTGNGPVSESMGDPDFIHAFALANNGEIDEAKYMIAHAASPVVKSFAQKMLADHTAAAKKLRALVATLTPKERLPVNTVTPAVQDAYQNLETRSGKRLDDTYMSDQLVDHQNVLELLHAEVSNGQSPAVRQFAASLEPVVAMHLAMDKGWIASKGTSLKPVS
jgi:putative membrane protein